MAEATVTMPESEYRRKVHAGVDTAMTHIGKNKGLIYAGAAGLGGYLALTSQWADKIKVFQENWWLKGAILLGLAYLANKKGHRDVALALGVLGLVFLAREYRIKNPAKPASGVEDEDTGYDWDGAEIERVWVESPPQSGRWKVEELVNGEPRRSHHVKRHNRFDDQRSRAEEQAERMAERVYSRRTA
jgi:hypothetical protein